MAGFNPAVIGRYGKNAILTRFAVVAVSTIFLTACNTARETTSSIPTDYRQRHPIVLSEKSRIVEIFIGTNRGGLSPAQGADVLAFAQAWKREATGGILIEIPAGKSNERAAVDSMHQIKSILSSAGLAPGSIRVVSYHAVDPRKLATVRLSYPKITAEAGPCGLWPSDLGPSFDRSYVENRPYWNLGCATQRNTAAMAANPADLVQPRGETPAYSGRRSVVLDKYRKGDSTATTYIDSGKGKISDVGK